MLDRDQDSKIYPRTVLRGVAAAAVRYISYTEEGALDSLEEWDEGAPLPAGIEFLLTMEDGKEYKRLFAVAGSS